MTKPARSQRKKIDYIDIVLVTYSSIMLKIIFALFVLLQSIKNFSLGQVPDSAVSWTEMYSTNGVKFSARNGMNFYLVLRIQSLNYLFSSLAHASCVFKKRLWVVGGRTDSYLDYNLLTNFRKADVWYSYNGGNFFFQDFEFILFLK